MELTPLSAKATFAVADGAASAMAIGAGAEGSGVAFRNIRSRGAAAALSSSFSLPSTGVSYTVGFNDA